MDYPTVKVSVNGEKIMAEVDIAPKPEAVNLVTVSQDEPPPVAPSDKRLPNWMLYSD